MKTYHKRHSAKHRRCSSILCSFTTFSSTLDWALAMCLLCEPGLGSQETGEQVMVVLPAVFSLTSGSSALESIWDPVMSRGLEFHAELWNLWALS